MQIRTARPEDYPAIVGVHNSLNITWPERPRTPEGWAEADRERHPKCKAQRWVAEVNGSEDWVKWGLYGRVIVQNAPMQAIFNKLGYARDPEWLQCQKDLPA